MYRIVHVSAVASYMQSVDNTSNTDKAEMTDLKMNLKGYKMTQSNDSKCVVSCFASRKPGYFLMNAYPFVFLIAVLALTLFSVKNYDAPEKRLPGSFTLILTLFNFKFVTNNTLPTISYLTSLDKYLLLSTICIVICCIWHALGGTLIQPIELQQSVDRVMLAVISLFLLLIQVWFFFTLIRSFWKIKQLQKKNAQYEKMIAKYD